MNSVNRVILVQRERRQTKFEGWLCGSMCECENLEVLQ